MKLYCVEVAPNPTKVRLYIAEKRAGGAPIEVTEVTVKLMKGEHRQPEHRQRTAFGSLPVLEIGPGDYIIESLTIIDYLEELYPEPNMSGDSPRERARIRELERIADVRVLTPIGQCVHATNSPIGLPPSEDVAAQARDRFTIGLDFINDFLSDGRRFVAGDAVTIADCTLAAALQFARFAKLDITTEFGALHRWDAEYRRRDPAAAILSL
jgi:glutathione S-transferase